MHFRLREFCNYGHPCGIWRVPVSAAARAADRGAAIPTRAGPRDYFFLRSIPRGIAKRNVLPEPGSLRTDTSPS